MAKCGSDDGFNWQDNQPKELTDNLKIDQKLHNLHNHPVEAGIVEYSEDYLYSSARDFSGLKRMDQ